MREMVPADALDGYRAFHLAVIRSQEEQTATIVGGASLLRPRRANHLRRSPDPLGAAGAGRRPGSPEQSRRDVRPRPSASSRTRRGRSGCTGRRRSGASFRRGTISASPTPWAGEWRATTRKPSPGYARRPSTASCSKQWADPDDMNELRKATERGPSRWRRTPWASCISTGAGGRAMTWRGSSGWQRR